MNNNTPNSAAWTRALSTLVAIAVVAMLSSCAHLNPPEPTPEPEPAVVEKKPPPAPIKPPPPSPLYEWWGKDYVSHIEVSINEQKARFYDGDQMVGWTTVASGVHKFPTPTGSFAVTEKVQNKKSNLYGKIYNKNGKLVRRNAKMGVHSIPAGGRFKGAPMPYFMRLTNDGIGMHAGPIPKPGNRASHGCIRMPRNFAPILYRHVDVGTPVTIKGNGPTYASYVSKQRKSAPKRRPVAVAKAAPPATPDTNVSPTAVTPAPTAGQSVPEQAVASVPQQGTGVVPAANAPSATLQQPAAPSMVEAPGTVPAQVSAEPQSGPTAEAAQQTIGMAGAPQSPPALPTQTPTPSAVVTPVPSVPQPIPPATAPSMTGAPATPAPAPTTPIQAAPAAPASQQSAPVSSAPPPAVAGPTAQADG